MFGNATFKVFIFFPLWNLLKTLEDSLGAQNRQKVLRLILRCLRATSPSLPNVAHFLLGFKMSEPLFQSSLQSPGMFHFTKIFFLWTV